MACALHTWSLRPRTSRSEPISEQVRARLSARASSRGPRASGPEGERPRGRAARGRAGPLFWRMGVRQPRETALRKQLGIACLTWRRRLRRRAAAAHAARIARGIASHRSDHRTIHVEHSNGATSPRGVACRDEIDSLQLLFTRPLKKAPDVETSKYFYNLYMRAMMTPLHPARMPVPAQDFLPKINLLEMLTTTRDRASQWAEVQAC